MRASSFTIRTSFRCRRCYASVRRSTWGERLAIIAGLVQRLEELHRQKLCPQPLRLERFGWRGNNGGVMLRDGGGTLNGIVDPWRLNELDAATRHVTTAADRLRVWRHFSDAPVPRRDRALAVSARRVAVAADHATSSEFGAIEHDGWNGVFARTHPVRAGFGAGRSISPSTPMPGRRR